MSESTLTIFLRHFSLIPLGKSSYADKNCLTMLMCKWWHGSTNMTRGNLKGWHGEETESYGLLMQPRHVAYRFSPLCEKCFSALVTFFKQTSLATTSYHVDVEDVSVIGDKQFVLVNVFVISTLRVCWCRNVSAIGDFLWLSAFFIYIDDFSDTKSRIGYVKELYYRSEIIDQWWLKKFKPCTF